MKKLFLVGTKNIAAAYRAREKELVITAQVTEGGGEEVEIIPNLFNPLPVGPVQSPEFAVVGWIKPGINPDFVRNANVEGVFAMTKKPATIVVVSEGPTGPVRAEIKVSDAPVLPVLGSAASAS